MNEISNKQMVFILFLSITSYTTISLPNIVAQSTARSSWIPILICSVFFSVAAVIITKLNLLFKNRMFIEYGKDIVGKPVIYIIAIYFAIYYILVGVYLKFKLITVLTSNFLPKTPQVVLIVSGITLFAYVSYKGITNVARFFVICGVLVLFITISFCYLMLRQGMFLNILPLYNPNEIEHIFSAIKKIILPFGGIDVLLVIPFTKKNNKAPVIAFITLLLIGIFYVLIIESAFNILGLNNTIILKDSFLEAIKLLHAPIVERTDIFYLTIGLLSLFAGKIIIFTVITEILCKLFKKAKRIIVVVIIAVVDFTLCLFAINFKGINSILDTLLPFMVIVSGVIIPLTLLITAKIRKVNSTKE